MLKQIIYPLSLLNTAYKKYLFAIFNLTFIYNLGVIFIIIFFDSTVEKSMSKYY